MKKEKLLLSLVVILMITLVVGNVYSLATENNGQNPIKITANKNNTANETAKNNTNNATSNENNKESVSGTVNGTNTTKNNTVKNTVKNATNNTNKNSTTTNSTSLPKAGTDSTTIFLALVFVASTIYAYKKVSDYNI